MSPLFTDTVVNTIISVAGGITITLITVFGGKKITKRADTPKNRADAVFDGYDKLLQQLQKESARKDAIIARKDERINLLEAMLAEKR